jgi:hypothetical protein
MELRAVGNGMAFVGGAMLMLEAIAAWCSSPQTGELNAGARSPTLLKYVTLGMASGAIMVCVAAYLEPAHAKFFIAGGLVAGGTIGAGYIHANQQGLKNPQQPTESY